MGTLSLDISKTKQNNMLNFAIIIDFLISLEAMKREFTIWPYGSCYRHIELWIYVKTINSL